MIHISTLQAAPNGIRAFTKLHFHYFHTFERIFSRTILYIHEYEYILLLSKVHFTDFLKESNTNLPNKISNSLEHSG